MPRRVSRESHYDCVTSYRRFVVFVCVGALAILDRLDEVDNQMLGWWLAERQLPNGGLNGRPEKLEDVGAIYYCALGIGLTSFI